jgi:hypothetical protein
LGAREALGLLGQWVFGTFKAFVGTFEKQEVVDEAVVYGMSGS